MSNPFTIMKYWLTWERLDLKALVKTIYQRSDLDLKKNKKITQQESNKR